MDTREYDQARQYHIELVMISERVRQLQVALGRQPSLLDRALFFTGSILIAVGLKLTKRVVVYNLAGDRL